jgi:hypothetical protein
LRDSECVVILFCGLCNDQNRILLGDVGLLENSVLWGFCRNSALAGTSEVLAKERVELHRLKFSAAGVGIAWGV